MKPKYALVQQVNLPSGIQVLKTTSSPGEDISFVFNLEDSDIIFGLDLRDLS